MPDTTPYFSFDSKDSQATPFHSCLDNCAIDSLRASLTELLNYRGENGALFTED
jgi:hypothetical protein